MQSERELLDDFWDQAMGAWNPRDKCAEMSSLQSLLPKVLSVGDFSGSSEWVCLKAYIHYCLRDRCQALEDFEQALRIDPNDGFARLYVAHCLYDDGKFLEVLESISKIEDRFLTEGLLLKKQELSIACSISLLGVADLRAEVSAHLEDCAQKDMFPFVLRDALKNVNCSLAEWAVPEVRDDSFFGICMQVEVDSWRSWDAKFKG